MNELPPYEREFFHHSRDGSCWPYLIQLPASDPQGLCIYLHGHYGDQYQGMDPDAFNGSFGKLRRECRRRQWVYVSPWYGGNSWMGPVAEQGLGELVELLLHRWPGRPVYLSGGSMGGSSALVFAVRRPELLSGVVALCPVVEVGEYYEEIRAVSESPAKQSITAALRLHYTMGGCDLAEQLKLRSALSHCQQLTSPLYLGHGSADELIPVGPCRELARCLHDAGQAVLYREVAGGGHDAPVVEVNWREALGFVAGDGGR